MTGNITTRIAPKKSILAFALALCLSGCINVRTHINGKVPCTYPGTTMGLEMIGYYPPIAVPMLVDLPLEIIADTLTFPYDVFVAP